eukprot:scaffold4213_cov201-Ochromonas_danica.AAC.7
MNDKDIQSLLKLLNIDNLPDVSVYLSTSSTSASSTSSSSSSPFSPIFKHYQAVMTRLMNIVLHSLGALRKLVIEYEKLRQAEACTSLRSDYDSPPPPPATTTTEAGVGGGGGGGGVIPDRGLRFQRELFTHAAKALLDRLLTAQDLGEKDPLRDLLESFPWKHSMASSHWLMVAWTLMLPHLHGNEKEEEEGEGEEEEEEGRGSVHERGSAIHVEQVREVLKFYPTSMAELDKVGQHYLAYALRCPYLEVVEEVLRYHPAGVTLVDPKGRQAIHYAGHYCQSVEALYLLAKYNNNNNNSNTTSTLPQLLLHARDDYGNTALHYASRGRCSLEVLKEIVFTCPELARLANNDGELPIHVATGQGSVEVVQTLAMTYPQGLQLTDRLGWLPIHHAAYHNKSVEVVKYLVSCDSQALLRRHVNSQRLALHYAVVHCPSVETVSYLLEGYPEGVKTFDCHRRLPLHYCLARCTTWTRARLRILLLLLTAYPYGVGMKDEEGYRPIDLVRRDLPRLHGDRIERLLLRADPSLDPAGLAALTYTAARQGHHQDWDQTRRRASEDGSESRETGRSTSYGRRSRRRGRGSRRRRRRREGEEEDDDRTRETEESGSSYSFTPRDEGGGGGGDYEEDDDWVEEEEEEGTAGSQSSRRSYSVSESARTYDSASRFGYPEQEEGGGGGGGGGGDERSYESQSASWRSGRSEEGGEEEDSFVSGSASWRSGRSEGGGGGGWDSASASSYQRSETSSHMYATSIRSEDDDDYYDYDDIGSGRSGGSNRSGTRSRERGRERGSASVTSEHNSVASQRKPLPSAAATTTALLKTAGAGAGGGGGGSRPSISSSNDHRSRSILPTIHSGKSSSREYDGDGSTTGGGGGGGSSKVSSSRRS